MRQQFIFYGDAFCKLSRLAVAVVFILLNQFAVAQTSVKPPGGNVNLHGFYIDEVIDNRPHPNEAGKIFISSKNQNTAQKANLNFDFLKIKNTILLMAAQGKSDQPLILRLKECAADETMASAGVIHGKVKVKLTLDLKPENDDDPVYLTDYEIESNYTRPVNIPNVAESLIRQSLSAGLNYLGSWLADQAGHNAKLARSVHLIFQNHQEEEGDTIYYAANRPIKWDDFMDKPYAGKYAAMVFPSFAFDQHHEIKNGVITVNVNLKIYVPKSACWVKDGNRNDYVLNHEQRHFDIVEIIGQRFKQDLSTQKIPVRNYEGLMNVKFYEYFRQMNLMQKQYDDETQHGLNQFKQQEWDTFIDKELLKFGIIKHDI